MERDVAIIGYSAVPISRYQAAGDTVLEHEMGAKVIVEACARAGVSKRDIDALVVAHPGEYTRQGYFHTFMAAQLGIKADATVIQVLGNGMTGGHAFDQAVMQVGSGQAKVALAFGVHFESGMPTQDHLDFSIRLTGDIDFQSIFGAVPIAWYAMDAARYTHEYGVPREVIATVAVKNRLHASLNPLAQFRRPISLEQVLAQRPIVEPLGLFEVPPRSDGAVCLVLTDRPTAEAMGRPYVAVRSRGFHHDGAHQLSDQSTGPLFYESLARATDIAYGRAGIQAGDIDCAQLYAPTTIVEVLASEAAGFFASGQGAYTARDGQTTLGGTIPLNTCGGCMSRGHPPEVSPLYDFVEACEQLLGRAGERQVGDAELSLVVSELGKYNAALAYILERGR